MHVLNKGRAIGDFEASYRHVHVTVCEGKPSLQRAKDFHKDSLILELVLSHLLDAILHVVALSLITGDDRSDSIGMSHNMLIKFLVKQVLEHFVDGIRLHLLFHLRIDEGILLGDR